MGTPKERKMRVRDCDYCGKTEEIRADNLSPRCRSCATSIQNMRAKQLRDGWNIGEWVSEHPGKENPNYKHGMTGTPTYHSWMGMISRCGNHKSSQYPFYGERGITVCERWLTFKNFLDDMGERAPLEQIHRIDNDKGYYPANCIWLDWRTHKLLHGGKIRLEEYLKEKKKGEV